jgi:hypothetical protein
MRVRLIGTMVVSGAVLGAATGCSSNSSGGGAGSGGTSATAASGGSSALGGTGGDGSGASSGSGGAGESGSSMTGGAGSGAHGGSGGSGRGGSGGSAGHGGDSGGKGGLLTVCDYDHQPRICSDGLSCFCCGGTSEKCGCSTACNSNDDCSDPTAALCVGNGFCADLNFCARQ